MQLCKLRFTLPVSFVQKILFVPSQSETSIRMSRATGLLRVASQGFSQPFLKTLAAVYPDLTDRHRLQSNQQLGTNTRQN